MMIALGSEQIRQASSMSTWPMSFTQIVSCHPNSRINELLGPISLRHPSGAWLENAAYGPGGLLLLQPSSQAS
jgi:hypothetical protein